MAALLDYGSSPASFHKVALQDGAAAPLSLPSALDTELFVSEEGVVQLLASGAVFLR